MDELNKIKTYRKEMYKDRLSDKLYMFDEVNKLSKDPGLIKQFNLLLRKRREMQRAQELMNKSKKKF